MPTVLDQYHWSAPEARTGFKRVKQWSYSATTWSGYCEHIGCGYFALAHSGFFGRCDIWKVTDNGLFYVKLSSISSGFSSWTGVTFDGKKWYTMADGGVNLALIRQYEYGKANINQTKTITVGSNTSKGMCMFGKYLAVLNVTILGDNIDLIDYDKGVSVKRINLYGMAGSAAGITTDGKNFFILEDNSATWSNVKMYNTKGTLLKSLAIKLGTQYEDITFDGRYFWLFV